MEALQEIRALARQFARDELRPNVERWDHDGAIGDDVIAQLSELGFFGMRIPEAFGGMEFDLSTYLAAVEELAWGEPAVALLVARGAVLADLLLRHGSDEQKRMWLERLASGDVLGSTAFPEGVHLEGVTARREDDGWTLQGTRSFVVAGRADLLLVPAKAEGSTQLFLVPGGAAGVSPGARASTMGFRAVDMAPVSFNDVRVPPDAWVPVDDADEIVRGSEVGRMSMAALSLGISQAALDHAVGYAAEREQFGQRLRAFEGIQFKLADMATRVQATRALLVLAAASPSAANAALIKLFASEAAMWVTTNAVQIFGGYGYMRDYPVEKLMRDAKGTELLEGANEELRRVIAEELYSSEG